MNVFWLALLLAPVTIWLVRVLMEELPRCWEPDELPRHSPFDRDLRR